MHKISWVRICSLFVIVVLGLVFIPSEGLNTFQSVIDLVEHFNKERESEIIRKEKAKKYEQKKIDETRVFDTSIKNMYANHSTTHPRKTEVTKEQLEELIVELKNQNFCQKNSDCIDTEVKISLGGCKSICHRCGDVIARSSIDFYNEILKSSSWIRNKRRLKCSKAKCAFGNKCEVSCIKNKCTGINKRLK